MRTLLLLILSLMTCAEVIPSTVKGCLGGWVEFSCKYPHINIDYTGVEDETNPPIRISKKNEWESRGRLYLYSDTDNKNVKVFIKQLRRGDIGEWWCKFENSEPITTKLGLESGKDVCQQPLDQTAYREAKTTLTCEYPDIKNKDVFFCKESSDTCEDVTPGTSPRSDQTFSLIKTKNSFSVSISPVSEEHEGVYWCGLKPKNGNYRFGFRKIELTVEKITNFQKSAQVGGTLNYFCKSHDNEPGIFICKGEDPSLCQDLISTTGQETSDGRFFIRLDEPDYFTIRLSDVQFNDSGIYWCGAQSTLDWFFHRMMLTVDPAPSTPTAVTTSTPAPHEGDGERDSESSEDEDHQWTYILGIVGSVLLLLLLMLVSFLIYKCLPKTRSKRNEATTSNIREDYVYEEIQERAQNPDSNAVAKTIYAMLDHPTNSSAALHYASISFQQSPNSARAEGLKPTYSTCEYSSVKTSQSPVGGLHSGPSGEPLYSTVNKKL